MSCTKHFLTFHWTKHNWRREVTETAALTFNETDQWGRRYPADYVICQARYVCQDCGEVRIEGACGCDPVKAEHCKVRLDLLAKVDQRQEEPRAEAV